MSLKVHRAKSRSHLQPYIRPACLVIAAVLLLSGISSADNIDTISTGMAVETALERLGPPTRVEETEKGRVYHFDDLFGPDSKLYIETDVEDRLVMLICAKGTNNECLTARGIHCGASMNDVEFAYGRPHERGKATVQGKEYVLVIYHIVAMEGAGDQELNLFFESDTHVLDMMILQARGWH